MKRVLNVLVVVVMAMLAVMSVAAQDEEMANIRIAHFVPDAPAVDVYFDGELSAVQGVSFSEVSDWFVIPAGTYAVAIVPAGGAVEDAVLEAELVVAGGDWVTVAAIGTIARETLTVAVIAEDYSPITFGEFRLTVFHAIDDALAVDVLANGDALFPLMEFPNSSVNEEGVANDGIETVNLLVGDFDIQVVSHTDNSDVLLDLGEVTFNRDNNYFVAAIGTLENPTFRLVSTNQARVLGREGLDIRTPANMGMTDAHLRVAHLSSGTPAVDVYLNGDLVAQAAEFGDVSEFFDLEVGTYMLEFVPEGMSLDDAVLDAEVTLGGGDWITVAVIGILENGTLTAHILEEDFSELPFGETRISIFHAIPAGSPVNVVRGDGLVLVRLLGYPGSQGDNDGFVSVDLVAGQFSIDVVSAANPSTVLFSIDDFTFVEGRNYFIAAIQGEPPFVNVYTELP